GVYGDLQLEFAVGRDGEAATGLEGFPGFAVRQFHGQGTGDDVHDFELAGAELVFADGHYADGGRTVGHVECDGFYGAVEILVDLEHADSSEGRKKAGKYAQARDSRHPLRIPWFGQ